MPFVPSNVTVSKTAGSFANLSYKNPKTDKQQYVTFSLKDCYSHFGVSENSNYGNFSLPISLKDERQVQNFLQRENRCEELLPTNVKPGPKRLLKCLYEKCNFTTMYLKLTSDQVVGADLGQPCKVNGKITFTAIYLGDKAKGYNSSIVAKVDDITLTPIAKRDNTPIDESDDE